MDKYIISPVAFHWLNPTVLLSSQPNKQLNLDTNPNLNLILTLKPNVKSC